MFAAAVAPVLAVAFQSSLAAAQGAAGVAAQAGGPVVLAPHRAIYDVLLDRARGGSGVSDLSGRMVYELTGSPCEGYTQTMRFVTRMTNQEGASSLTDMRSTSWEDAAFKAFRFDSTQYKDEKLQEATLGDAARTDMAAEGKIELTKPEKKQVVLKSNVLFPIQHSIAMLQAARQGESLFKADLYDGSEKGEKFYATTAFIGKAQEAGANAKLPKVANAERLDGMRSWPISISYFEAGAEKQDAAPSYELAFLFFDNGVSRRLYIDYGDFSIKGTLKQITFLEPGKCEAKP